MAENRHVGGGGHGNQVKVDKKEIRKEALRRRKKNNVTANKIRGVEIVCKSQENDELYIKLWQNNKIDDFLALIRLCSSRQFTKEMTCENINEIFKYFVEDKPFTVERFNKMLGIYPDVAQAWYYGTYRSEIEKIKVREKATQIILSMDTKPIVYGGKVKDVSYERMKAIELWNKLYNDDYGKN